MPARDAVEMINGKDREESSAIPEYLFRKFLEHVHIRWIEQWIRYRKCLACGHSVTIGTSYFATGFASGDHTLSDLKSCGVDLAAWV